VHQGRLRAAGLPAAAVTELGPLLERKNLAAARLWQH
jgi:hypothetical protein